MCTDRQKDSSHVVRLSRRRRKSCRRRNCISLDNISSFLERGQQIIKTASRKPSESLVNGASQMNLQKYIDFPVGSKDTSIRRCSFPVLKGVVLYEHHPGRDLPTTAEGDDKSSFLMF